jgi:hypothetical protein
MEALKQSLSQPRAKRGAKATPAAVEEQPRRSRGRRIEAGRAHRTQQGRKKR